MIVRSVSLGVIFWLGLLCYTQAQNIQAASWKLEKEKSDIKVYKLPFDGGDGKESKAVMEIESSLNALVALIKDSEAGTKWLSKIKIFETVETVDEKEWYTYAEAELPFPFSNRDLVTRNYIRQFSNKTVRVYLESATEKVAEKKGLKRIKEAEGFWQFRPLSNGKVEVIYQFYSEPHLDLPAWIKDPIIANGLITTMKNLRDEVKKEEYQDQKLSYIKE